MNRKKNIIGLFAIFSFLLMMSLDVSITSTIEANELDLAVENIELGTCGAPSIFASAQASSFTLSSVTCNCGLIFNRDTCSSANYGNGCSPDGAELCSDWDNNCSNERPT